MVARDERTRPLRSWPWWRWVLTGLSTLALGLSVYLSAHALAGGPVIGCASGSACDQVLSSRWSTIRGVPVSGLAAGAYMAMLVASLCVGPATAAPVRRLAWAGMLVLAVAAAGSAAWFFFLQRWVIGAFCPYCTATHITGLLVAALVLWRAPLQFDNDTADVTPAAPLRVMGPWPAIGLALVGLALAGLLAACQVVTNPPAAYRGGESQAALSGLDPCAVPLVGSPDALYVVTLLFDYKCPHCQELHFLLDEAARRYDGKLAFALCPTPLNTQCNPYVSRDVDAYKDSCELARVGLAVWLADRKASPAFDLWMFSMESGDRWRPRGLDAARAKAVELVGQAAFDTACADPWIDRHLQTSVQVYGATIRSGHNAIPKMVFGSRWVIPQPYDADDLVSILQTSLHIPLP